MEVRERPLSTADLAETSETKPHQDESGAVPAKSGPAVPAQTSSGMGSNNKDELIPLFSNSAVQGFRSRWTSLQTEFVDEPRRSVEQADELVARVMKDMAATFSEERKKLEQQWEHGDQVSTEDLRLVLRRYRTFFERFLSI